MPRFFTFEEFRDQIVKPDYDAGLIDHDDGFELDHVAEACLILYVHEGILLKEQQGENIIYIRTAKQLPPPRLK